MTKSEDSFKRSDELLASILGLALHFLETLRFDRNDPQQLFSICLYARLLELATACKALLEKNAVVGIPILLRSMFEADIDLINLLRCRDYHKRMYASFLKEKLRLTKEAASSRPNPLLTAIRANRNCKKDLNETQTELDRLLAEKNGPIDIRCRAEFAGKLDEYLSNYNSLCLDTHNNIRSLENWHIEKMADADYQVVVFKQTKTDVVPEAMYISHILLYQTKSLADFLGTTGIEFDGYFAALHGLADSFAVDAEEYCWPHILQKEQRAGYICEK
jgi:hypothetical protein